MADIASVFHWPPATMAAMTLEELMQWRELAVARWTAMNIPKEKQ